MTHFASRIAGAATLALAVLPVLAISTAAAAAPVAVKVSDLDLASAQGRQEFAARASKASDDYCRAKEAGATPLAARALCREAVRAELDQKMPAVRQAQIARTTYAAR